MDKTIIEIEVDPKDVKSATKQLKEMGFSVKGNETEDQEESEHCEQDDHIDAKDMKRQFQSMKGIEDGKD